MGFSVVGVDIDEHKVEQLNRRRSYIKHIKHARIRGAACTAYSEVVDKIVLVFSPRLAETAKLLGNTHRYVNIAKGLDLRI